MEHNGIIWDVLVLCGFYLTVLNVYYGVKILHIIVSNIAVLTKVSY